MLLERVPAAGKLANTVTQVRRATNGLGGGHLDHPREDQRISNMTTEFLNDESIQIEEGRQPEKKPKLELLADLEYESSRFIRNLQDLRVMPKSHEPANHFDGGNPAKKMIGYGKSRLIDLGVVMGRSSTVGWSENGCFVWSAQPAHNQVLFGTLDRSSDVSEVGFRL